MWSAASRPSTNGPLSSRLAAAGDPVFCFAVLCFCVAFREFAKAQGWNLEPSV